MERREDGKRQTNMNINRERLSTLQKKYSFAHDKISRVAYKFGRGDNDNGKGEMKQRS